MDKKTLEMARAEIRRMVREEADPIIAEIKLVAEHLGRVQEEMMLRGQGRKTGDHIGSPLQGRGGKLG